LHVANERSSTVTTFRLDPDTGVPTELVGTTPVGSPTCLVPQRMRALRDEDTAGPAR